MISFHLDAFTSLTIVGLSPTSVVIKLILVGGITVNSYVIHYFNTESIPCLNSSGAIQANGDVQYRLSDLEEGVEYFIIVNATLSDGVTTAENITATTLTISKS